MNALSSIQNISHLDEKTFFLLAGPCVVENESIVFQIAEKIKSISDKHRIPFVFKASYRKKQQRNFRNNSN
mgnify:CR=1 FL=1